MKKKILSILILIVLLLNSSLLMVISEAVSTISEEMNSKEGTNVAEAIIELSPKKYFNFDTTTEGSDTGSKGLLIQVNLKTGIKYNEGEEYGPIKNTTTKLQVPEIEGKKPERVSVIVKSTKATNGGNTANYEYDANTGLLRITTENVSGEDGSIYSDYVENARDEYEIIFIYNSDTYKQVQEYNTVEIKVQTSLEVVHENVTNLSAEITNSYEVLGNVGEAFSIEYINSDIYNGYITANTLNSDNQYKTEYTETIKATISNKDIAQKIAYEITNKPINNEQNEIDNNQLITFKQSILNKSNVLDIIGENGSVDIKISDTEIKTINKDTETDENGQIIINYPESTISLSIQVNNPIKEGILEFISTKTIEPEMIYNKIRTNIKIKGINTIEEKTIVEETNEDGEKTQKEETKQTDVIKIEEISSNDVEIKNAFSNIDIGLNTTSLVNNVANDVVITATLRTDDPKYSLFKNPTITIEMPAEVEEVILGDVQEMYNNKVFTILDAKVSTNASGNKVITITLAGQQTAYEHNSLIEGTNILIPAKIYVQKDLEDMDTNFKLTYTNEMATDTVYSVEQKPCEDIPVKLLNKVGVDIPGSGDDEEEQPPVLDTAEGINIEVVQKLGNQVVQNGGQLYERQIIKQVLRITNTNSTAKNVQVTANVPEQMTYVELAKGGYIYHPDGNYYTFSMQYEYIEKTDRQVTINAGTIAPGATVEKEFELKVKDLPDDQDNVNSSMTFSINGTEMANATRTNVIRQAKLSIELTSQIGNGRKDWSYGIKVTNLTDEELKDIDVTLELSPILDIKRAELENNVIGGYEGSLFSYNISSLKPKNNEEGENKETGYILLTVAGIVENFNEDDGYEYTLNGVASANNPEYGIYISNYTTDKGNIEAVEITMTSDKEGQQLEFNEEITYTVTIKNVGKVWGGIATYTKVNVQDFFSEGLEPISATYNDFTLSTTYIEDPNYPGVQNKVENFIEETRTRNLTTKIVREGYDEESSPNIDWTLTIPEGKTVTMVIKAKAKMVFNDTTVSNKFVVQGDFIKTKTAVLENEVLSYNYVPGVDPDDPTDPDNPPVDPDDPDIPVDPDDPDIPVDPDKPETKTVKISGTAWVDSEEDGRRATTESTFAGMQVMLFDYKNNEFVKKDDSNLIVTTNDSGYYEFTDIPEGKYVVVFLYNTDEYSLTTYQETGVSDMRNSDAVSKTITIDGKETLVGITDTLDAKEDLSDIDIGLVEKKLFDMEIQKYINKITVQTSKETKTYDYENKQFAQVQIHSKQINGANVLLEYKMVITNKGELTGRVGLIEDDLPDGLTFYSELNSDWYISDGKLYSNVLATEEIPAGESKELTLILGKRMTGDNVGTTTNTATISMSSNEKAVEDGNANNNTSKAEVLIQVSTGLIRWIGITMGIILILALIAFAIILFKNKKLPKIFMFILVIGLCVLFNPIEIKAVNEDVEVDYPEDWDSLEEMNADEGAGQSYEYIDMGVGYFDSNGSDRGLFVIYYVKGDKVENKVDSEGNQLWHWDYSTDPPTKVFETEIKENVTIGRKTQQIRYIKGIDTNGYGVRAKAVTVDGNDEKRLDNDSLILFTCTNHSKSFCDDAIHTITNITDVISDPTSENDPEIPQDEKYIKLTNNTDVNTIKFSEDGNEVKTSNFNIHVSLDGNVKTSIDTSKLEWTIKYQYVDINGNNHEVTSIITGSGTNNGVTISKENEIGYGHNSGKEFDMKFYIKLPKTAMVLGSIEVKAKYKYTRELVQNVAGNIKVNFFVEPYMEENHPDRCSRGNVQSMCIFTNGTTTTSTMDVNITEQLTINLAMRPYGDIRIQKRDADQTGRGLEDQEFIIGRGKNTTGAYFLKLNGVDKIKASEIKFEHYFVEMYDGTWILPQTGNNFIAPYPGSFTVTVDGTSYTASFTSDKDSATRFLTNSSGEILFKDLRMGAYTFIEVENGKYGYTRLENTKQTYDGQYSSDINSSVRGNVMTAFEEEIYTVYNQKQTGSFHLQKIDDRNGEALAGVEFVLRAEVVNPTSTSKPLNGYIRVQVDGQSGYADRAVGDVRISDRTLADSEMGTEGYQIVGIDQATRFVTDSNGLLSVVNLLMSTNGNDSIRYHLEEVYNPNYGYLADTGTLNNFKVTFDGNAPNGWITISRLPSNDTDNAGSNAGTSTVVQNHQMFIRISGQVWKDLPDDTKNNTIDSQIGDNEKFFNGIKVYLYKRLDDGSAVKIAETVTRDNPYVADDDPYKHGWYQFGTHREDSNSQTSNGQQINNNNGYLVGDYAENGQPTASGGNLVLDPSNESGDLLIDDLGKYYIEFEYDGLVYTTVATQQDINGNWEYAGKSYNNISEEERAEIRDNRLSKVEEVPSNHIEGESGVADGKDRDRVDKNFSTIVRGEALNENGSHTYNLEYTRLQYADGTEKGSIEGANIGTFNQHWGYEETEKTIEVTNPVSDGYSNEGDYAIIASTQQSGYNLEEKWKAAYEFSTLDDITNNNMGLYEREQPDIAILSDIEKVRVIMQGQEYTYFYKSQNLGTTNTDNEADMQVRFQKKYTDVYKRPINPSDIAFINSEENQGVQDILQVYVTYMIKVENRSSTVAVKVKDIVNYFDKNYTINQGSNTSSGWQQTENAGTYEQYAPNGNHTGSVTDNNYHEVHTNILDGKIIPAGKSSIDVLKGNSSVDSTTSSDGWIRIEFKVNYETIKGLLNEDAPLQNVSEIASYSTYYGKGTIKRDGTNIQPDNTEFSYYGTHASEYYMATEKFNNYASKDTDYISYAAIDYNSGPENAEPSRKEEGKLGAYNWTYENDTDQAPTFLLSKNDTPDEVANYKIISGNVYEDLDIDEGDDERLGDGMRTEPDEENGVQNVRVELIDLDENGNVILDDSGKPRIAKLYSAGGANTNSLIPELGADSENNIVRVKDAIVYTDENGNYQFGTNEGEQNDRFGVASDNYILKFTYGDKEKYIIPNTSLVTEDEYNNAHTSDNLQRTENVQSAIKGNVINARNYKSTIITEENNPVVYNVMQNNNNDKWHVQLSEDQHLSVAVDDIAERLSVPALQYSNYEDTHNISAYTRPFKLQVEYTTDQTSNIDPTKQNVDGYDKGVVVDGNVMEGGQVYDDNLSVFDFGIIERPREDIVIDKSISNIKITLSNGQVLVDGDPYSGNLDYVQALGPKDTIRDRDDVSTRERMLRVEMDTELIQNARLELTYEITVTNNSEIDYDYGHIDQNTAVTMTEYTGDPTVAPVEYDPTLDITEEHASYMNQPNNSNITYDGNTALDYITENENTNYYYFGENTYDDGSQLPYATNSIQRVVDYVDNEMEVDLSEDTNKHWVKVTADYLKDAGLISYNKDTSTNAEKTYEAIIDDQYLIFVTNIFAQIKQSGPDGDGNSHTEYLHVSKTLGNQTEDYTYENHVEILKTHEKNARTIKEVDHSGNDSKQVTKEYKPGNYIPSLESRKLAITEDLFDIEEPGYHQQDDDAITVRITPPTGSTNYIILYVTITAIGLVALSVGVYFIKKKVIG